jgi:diguanylate cyclase (GGDEF)-like protein/PAS domain S-box-containing protein
LLEVTSKWDAAAVLDALPERVIRFRVPELTIIYCNTAWAAQYNLVPSEAVGRRLDEFLLDDGLAGLHQQLALLGPDAPVLTDSSVRAAPNAPGEWVEWVDRYLVDEDGAQVLAVGRNVTRRYLAELQLAESEARFRDLADKSADVVWRFATEPVLHFSYMSPSVEKILGYPPEYFLEDFMRMLDILDDTGRAAIARALNGGGLLERFDFRFRHADGSIVIGETQTSVVPGGLQGVSRDVTELRHLQQQMEALALRDPLTGLANRRLFNELFDADLARTQRSGFPLAVAFLDLDRLKDVNDTYGHDAGDNVLCETARRLQSVVRSADILARLAGDEFVVVFEPADPGSANLIRRIEAALNAPMQLAPDVTVLCPASIGVADTRQIGYDGAKLLAAADRAMYEMKRSRRTGRSA